MPLLRRTYDHHRTFPARMSAKTPARTSSSGNQDRHLMMPSSLCEHRHCHSDFSRRAAGFTRSCARRRDGPSAAVQIGTRKRRPDMLTIILYARTSRLMLTPSQLTSGRAAKYP